MTPKTITHKLADILMIILAIGILSTASCSSSMGNPVSTGLSNSDELTSQAAPQATNDDLSREGQIYWYEHPEGETEPNDSADQAHQVYHAQCYNGHVDSVTDQNDYFFVDLTWAPASLYVKLGWSTDDWLNLYVYDAAMNPVVYNNYEVAGPKEFFCWQLDPGIYYIRVKAFEGGCDYRLKFGVGRQYYEPQNDTIETTTWDATSTEGLRSVVSDTEDQNDYLMITIPDDDYNHGIKANLDWVALPGADLNVYLYDVAYNPIVFSNGSACPEAFGSEVLEAGTYYIRVKAATGEAIYELTAEVTTQFVPNPDIFNKQEYPHWTPPGDPPTAGINLPHNPEDYMDWPMDIPPQFNPFSPLGPWGDNGWGTDDQYDLPQLPEFGY